MAVKMKLKPGVTAVWGTGGLSAQGFGKLRSAGRSRNAQREQLPDEEGNTVGLVYFDETDELSLEVMCASSMTNPEVGDTIAVDSVTGYVDSWEIRWDHKGVKMLSIKATRFVSGGIP